MFFEIRWAWRIAFASTYKKRKKTCGPAMKIFLLIKISNIEKRMCWPRTVLLKYNIVLSVCADNGMESIWQRCKNATEYGKNDGILLDEKFVVGFLGGLLAFCVDRTARETDWRPFQCKLFIITVNSLNNDAVAKIWRTMNTSPDAWTKKHGCTNQLNWNVWYAREHIT